MCKSQFTARRQRSRIDHYGSLSCTTRMLAQPMPLASQAAATRLHTQLHQEAAIAANT
jgi:hypothetical protein